MFKKKPQIKNLSPLRSSERRKLADQIRKDYEIPDPREEPRTVEDKPELAAPGPPSLTTLRNTLLPESTSYAKFTTTHGPNSLAVAGHVYVGAHPGEEERILWFQIGKDDRLIPTVYTLWHNPGLVPLLHVGDMVVTKLKGGAELFAPGIVRPSRGIDARATKNSIVAVASVRTDTVPRWVGISDIDLTSLQENASGTAVRGLHWEGDELWSWSALNKGGKNAPLSISGWPGFAQGIEDDVQSIDIHSDEAEDDEQAEGGVTLDASGNGKVLAADEVNSNHQQDEEEYVPTTKEIDDAFIEAFLYSVWAAKKTTPTEPHGFQFPIQPSFLIANMIQPHLRRQTPHYNIKKTSWKNAKKFIKHLDKTVLVKSKDRNGGETVILDIDFNDQQVQSFQPYPLPKSKSADDTNATGGGAEAQGATDPSLNQKLLLKTLYRASAKLVPDLLPSKTMLYTSQQITAALKEYIESRPDLINENRKRFVKLDPFIANNILGSNPSRDDNKALAAGEIDRGLLSKRVLENDHLAIPYHILLRNEQVYNPNEPDPALKPKAGPPPKITLTIERRGGNKVVTAVAGLEHFFINPQVIRPELQKKCAGSASVGQLVGGKPGMLEVQVQGDQRNTIETEILGKRGVKPEWIEVVDKTKKKSSK